MSVKEQKKKQSERVEDIRYSGAVPKAYGSGGISVKRKAAPEGMYRKK